MVNEQVSKTADTIDALQQLQLHFGSGSTIGSHHAVASPLVSVIIPTYNCLPYLPKAIRSVQQQTVESLEIIVLDDGSSDETWYYLRLASKCDRRIRPVRLKNGGVANARNHGLELAKGQYVAFLDADDYWYEHKLGSQLAFHQNHPMAVMSFCNYLHITPQNEDLGDCFGYYPGFARLLSNDITQYDSTSGYRLLPRHGLAVLYGENVVGTSSVMINRQAIGEPVWFDQTLKSAEDWDYWLNLAKRGAVGFTTRVDMAYLMRPGSETSKVGLRLQYMGEIIRRYLPDVLRTKPSAVMVSISQLLIGYAEYYRKDKRGLRAFACHFGALVLRPSRRLLRSFLADCKNLVWR